MDSRKMARLPCCDKMGLKKGPWTPEEDQILTSYVQQYGHQNWRALPKLAGLLRCGKSCRLRWTNYLRPDIKRGNFSKEEEDTIIKLHQNLGNRWSAISNRLPGRTDNEIKNHWHTHLKKRVQQNQGAAQKLLRCSGLQRVTDSSSSAVNSNGLDYCIYAPCRPETTLKKSAKDSSSSTGTATALDSKLHDYHFGSTAESGDDISTKDDMVFWYNLFVNAEKSEEY